MRPQYQFESGGQRRPIGTFILIGAIILGFLAGHFTYGRYTAATFFVPGDFANRPWTTITFFTAVPPRAILAVLFSSLWLYGIGTVVEREITTKRLLLFWAIVSLLTAAMHELGAALTGVVESIWGPWVPLAALTVVWGTRYPNQEVLFMFVLRIQAKYVAWISVLLVFFGTDPKLAGFALVPIGLAYLYASNKLPYLSYGAPVDQRIRKRQDSEFKEFLAKTKDREREREEKERLRKLLEGSVKEEE